ncbi:mitochondrial 2-oxoglutarate dehydrogenase E2 (dihydrolipoamide succinyltransferase) [Andalucia godoyi]|uniref:dihydrolipoyllysine-residue succinyltransferase n=1 Tax=Andalucia godoyi TaxID=505711 RepID=A0A8K0F2W3_ANDGO|nr:mitochondrial 2-oxoglutarate dehydrogenase E2 (dihydrolipoamide succinyltransferase) [Andalucia godoyi]|eukprot:ANDGO_04102.mRNA.1 mitochondrial 2-oxoglutarate dehydrogenase E2 (dihydrolipoamide succinyltransferase)
MMSVAAFRSGPCRAVPRALCALRYSSSSSMSMSMAMSPMSVSSPSLFVAAPRCARRFFSSSPAIEDIVVPKMGDSITEGTVMGWLKNPGDAVKVDDVLVQLETDKITVEVRSHVGGALQSQLANKGDAVKVGAIIAKVKVGAAGSTLTPAAPAAAAAAAPAATPAAAATTKASESAAEKKSEAKKTAVTEEKKSAGPQIMVGAGELETRTPMSRMRKRIAERLKDAQNTYALLTTFNEVDMSALIEMRKVYGESFEKKHGTKLGFMSPFVKASANALKNQPLINAVIDGTDIVYRSYVDVSVAVATPTGLVVPVLRNCQDMGFADVEKELGKLSEKARTGQLSMDDMQGGTFTISNGGVFGSLFGTPIVNPPQSAILGMHATKPRPVAVDGKVEVRPMMYLALTYDHRLIDGREAVTFLKSIKEQIEDPRRIILDL